MSVNPVGYKAIEEIYNECVIFHSNKSSDMSDDFPRRRDTKALFQFLHRLLLKIRPKIHAIMQQFVGLRGPVAEQCFPRLA